MRVLQNFDPAEAGESEVFAFDFAKDLTPGEAISTTSWSLSVMDGKDSAPASRLSGLAQVLGTQSQQRIANLVSGVTYKVTATVVTTSGNTLKLWSVIVCG